mmetsp:Transcript_21592/g.15826  ORF Transcript_21592/g.15826 Transcript_21592/m.15826 type:complete len:169 (-) Transcript_21592:174-680(-)
MAIDRFKSKILGRGAKGLIGLKRQFKIMDSDGSGALDRQEFGKALQDYKVQVSEQEADQLFSIFDKNRDGTINFEEFMNAVLGELNATRRALVMEAFKKLDANGNGVLEIDEVKEKFEPSRHPDVKSGQKSVEECRYEFFDLFQSHHNVAQSFQPNRSVELEEFMQYH